MGANQFVAQAGDRGLRRARQHQLIRIRPAIVSDGHRFAPPHELRAADAEISPPAPSEIARMAVRRAIPPFHRQNAEAITDSYTIHKQRMCERAGWIDDVVK